MNKSLFIFLRKVNNKKGSMHIRSAYWFEHFNNSLYKPTYIETIQDIKPFSLIIHDNRKLTFDTIVDTENYLGKIDF